MYLEHFALHQLPFGLTPNTDFYFGLPPHEEALEVLRVALASGEGFIKVTGEVGTGKTLLLRKLLDDLAVEYQLAYLPNPYLTPDELRRALALELGIAVSSHELAATDAIQHRLIHLHREGRRVVLLLDEAQAIPDATLKPFACLAIWRPSPASCCKSYYLVSRNWTNACPRAVYVSSGSASLSPIVCALCYWTKHGLILSIAPRCRGIEEAISSVVEPFACCGRLVGAFPDSSMCLPTRA